MSISARREETRTEGLSLKRWLTRELVLLVLLAALIVVMSLLSDRFLTMDNFRALSPYLVEPGLIAISMTMVIIIKGIDISVGSMLAMAALALGFSWEMLGLNIWLAVLIGIAAGTLAGLLNGLIISRVRVPDLIVTLATMSLYRGLAEGLSGGKPVSNFPAEFLFLGQGYLLGIPTQLFILVPAVIVGGFVLSRTAFGRYLYAMGNNEVAARFAGVNVDRLKLIVYALSGFLTGLASVIYVARLSTAKSNAGLGLELDVITVVVLGGTSIAGGEGSIWGSALGLLLITLLRNGLLLAGLSADVRNVLIGALMIATVMVNEALRRR